MSHGRIYAAVGLSAAAAFLWGRALDIQWLRLATKAIPVLCMAAWLWPEVRREKYHRWLCVGLVFSALGDVLLEIPARLFVPGLLAFLVAHLCYIAAYLQDTRELHPLRSVPAFGYGVALCSFLLLYGKLGALAAPVIVYAAVICCMLWRAAARYGVEGLSRFSMHSAMLGAAIFALSDSLIALNKFHAPIPGVGYAIMATYWAGQLGIISSVRK